MLDGGQLLKGLYSSLGPIQYVFHFIDADGDGVLTRAELDQFWEDGMTVSCIEVMPQCGGGCEHGMR